MKDLSSHFQHWTPKGVKRGIRGGGKNEKIFCFVFIRWTGNGTMTTLELRRGRDWSGTDTDTGPWLGRDRNRTGTRRETVIGTGPGPGLWQRRGPGLELIQEKRRVRAAMLKVLRLKVFGKYYSIILINYNFQRGVLNFFKFYLHSIYSTLSY